MLHIFLTSLYEKLYVQFLAETAFTPSKDVSSTTYSLAKRMNKIKYR
jgi:hypothetical protein